MPKNKSGFQLKGAGPEAYERYMVPIHCKTLAEDLVDRVRVRPRERVLDIACGTGIVARYAADLVGTLGHVTGVELNPAMIEVAQHASTYYDQIEFLEGVEHLVRYETLNMPQPEVHTLQTQEALKCEMETLAEANIDDHGVVFPVQQFVVVARR